MFQRSHFICSLVCGGRTIFQQWEEINHLSKVSRLVYRQKRLKPEAGVLTLDLYHGVSLDDAELGGGYAGVGVGLADVVEEEDVLADWNGIIRREVLDALAPLHKGHRAANSHTGDVEVAAVLHIVFQFGPDCEVGRHSAHCKQTISS